MNADAAPILQPIFVVGVPRSGTTWILRMLATHPQAWPLLETYMFSRQIGLSALLRSVPAADPTNGENYELAPAGLGRMFSRDELVGELRQIARRWFERASGPSARFVIEKSPWHLSDAELIAEVLPDARFVHVIRDGRDVAVSLIEARRSWSRFRSGSRAAVLREAAELWARGIEKGELAAAILAERLLEVRYEDVRSDPAVACRTLFEHCRMPHDDRLVEHAVTSTDIDRTDARGEDRTVRSGRVGEWRERFGVRDALAFERRAGSALRATGYEPDPAWWRRCPWRSRL